MITQQLPASLRLEASLPKQCTCSTLFPTHAHAAVPVQTGGFNTKVGQGCRWSCSVPLPLGHHGAPSWQSLEASNTVLPFCARKPAPREKWLLRVTAHVSGRAAPEPRGSGSQSHSVAREAGEGHLTQPRGQGRLPGGGDRAQGRGVSQAMGVRRVRQGIPGCTGQ